MKAGTIIILILTIVFVGVLALCGLTAFGTYSWFNANTDGVHFFYSEDTSFELVETETYPVSGAVDLILDTSFGNISITTHEANVIEIEKEITAWGEDKESAQARAESLPIEIKQNGDSLSITYKPENRSDVAIFGEVRGDSVNFNIKVPAETAVEVDSSFGKILLDGVTGGANLTGGFGDITVTNVSGSLVVKGMQSKLDVSTVDAGEESIHLETTFGGITAEGLSGASLFVRTSNGEMVLTEINTAEGLAMENQFGAIRLEEFQAESLKLVDMNGAVELLNGTLNGPLDASTTFGEITVTNVEAERYVLDTNNGNLVIDGAQGELQLSNQFGPITVLNAEQAILTAKSSNGMISFSGSLDEDASHLVETSFGEIALAIPEDSNFSLSLDAQMGKIDSEIPVMLSGSMSENHWEADMNEGGNKLTMKTNNGNIYILKLSEEQ
ncbi:MAG: hypothetical protein EHM41_07120 [Chloroflexi bacterium]|nr:MAG: hypothetical protein EHM41_07120 [Chloroflexota bacterium]